MKPLCSHFLGIRHSTIIFYKILAKLNVHNVVKLLHWFVFLLSPGQTIATSQRNISQHCWPSICKLRPNHSSIWTQQIATLLDATCCTRSFGHPVATCCDMLRVQNRTSAHAQAQHCCTNLAKRLQHHASSTNVEWKIWPFSNLSQQQATCRTQQCCDMLHWNFPIVWPGL